MKAEREKRAQILEAEGMRQAAILKAEGEKQALMLAAEGRKEAAFRDAEARERSAEAEAKATEMVSRRSPTATCRRSTTSSPTTTSKALEALAKSPNQKMLMMPLEASSVIGSLGRHRRDRWRGVRRRLRQCGAAADRRQGSARQRSDRVIGRVYLLDPLSPFLRGEG